MGIGSGGKAANPLLRRAGKAELFRISKDGAGVKAKLRLTAKWRSGLFFFDNSDLLTFYLLVLSDYVVQTGRVELLWLTHSSLRASLEDNLFYAL